MKGNIGQLMKQAQMMQENMRRMQEQLGTLEVEGQSGAGMVKVQMTCKHEVKRGLGTRGVDQRRARADTRNLDELPEGGAQFRETPGQLSLAVAR